MHYVWCHARGRYRQNCLPAYNYHAYLQVSCVWTCTIFYPEYSTRNQEIVGYSPTNVGLFAILEYFRLFKKQRLGSQK